MKLRKDHVYAVSLFLVILTALLTILLALMILSKQSGPFARDIRTRDVVLEFYNSQHGIRAHDTSLKNGALNTSRKKRRRLVPKERSIYSSKVTVITPPDVEDK